MYVLDVKVKTKKGMRIGAIVFDAEEKVVENIDGTNAYRDTGEPGRPTEVRRRYILVGTR